MLGADAVVPEPAGLLLRIADRVLGTLGHANRPTSLPHSDVRAAPVSAERFMAAANSQR